MKMRILIALLVLPVAGCGIAKQQQLAQMKADATEAQAKELAACKTQFPNRERGKAADALRCTTTVQQRYAWLDGQGQNNDLVKLAAAKSIEAGERYDAGKITDAGLDVELASIQAELNSGTQQRLAQNSVAEAAQTQAAAAQQQAALAQSRAITAAFAPKSTTTNCSSFGNNVNCVSY